MGKDLKVIQGAQGLVGATGLQGTPGVDGKTILNGTSNPTSIIGNNGDFFINTSTNTLFGPKANGNWPVGVSLVGPAGTNTNSNFNFDWHIPDGFKNVEVVKEQIIVPFGTLDITPYTVPNGKNFYLHSIQCIPKYYDGGITVNGIVLDQYPSSSNDFINNIPTKQILYPMIFSSGSIISYSIGSSIWGSSGGSYLTISGFLVDKKVECIFQNSNYIVPSNYFFISMKPKSPKGKIEGSYSWERNYTDSFLPIIYDSNTTVPAGINGYIILK